MDNVRIFFAKTGRAVYISHLDLYRVFQRAVRRAKLPIWETEGFNPHVYITFALPLSLGTEGRRESLDTRLTEALSFDELCARLGCALPEGIEILEAATPVFKNTDIARSEYEILHDADEALLSSFFGQERIAAEKRTKRGVAEIDLKPSLEIKEREPGRLKLLLPSGTETNLNPNLVFDTFEKEFGTAIGRLR
ncbi:MAG: TIGR03936 family radical SAM-associated protein, partial [Eubacterium sp.]|nr:TIGR03936 family radical SAM-associated protein [Eubacterium sp.]